MTYTQAVLDNYTLRAPYDALVVARNLQLGAMPVPGQAVFTLVDPATIWVLGYVDERLAGGIALGQPAEITLRSEPGRHHPGHVARIEIQSDAVNEERLVEVAFDDIPRDIHLAEQAEVVITTGSLDRAVLVPQTAVSGLHGEQGTVWTVEDGKLARRDVTFGAPLLDGGCRSSTGCRRAPRSSSRRTSGLRAGRAAVIAETRIEMNLALRDVRHNALRFALTALGLGLLFGVVISMTGIYEGALDDALRLPRAASPDLWVVQPRTHGPFAEPSRIPRDTRDLVRRIPGVAAAGAVTFQTVQTVADGKPLRMFVQGYEPGRPGGPQRLAAGADITASHYQIVIDISSGLRLGQQIPLGPLAPARTRWSGLTSGMVTSAGDPVAWVTLHDAQSLQFALPPALERREQAAGRPPPQTGDINAVLVRLAPGVPAAIGRRRDRALEASGGGVPGRAGKLPDRVRHRQDAAPAWHVHGDPDHRLGGDPGTDHLHADHGQAARDRDAEADRRAGPGHRRADPATGDGARRRGLRARPRTDPRREGPFPAPRDAGTARCRRGVRGGAGRLPARLRPRRAHRAEGGCDQGAGGLARCHRNCRCGSSCAGSASISAAGRRGSMRWSISISTCAPARSSACSDRAAPARARC